MNEKINEFTDIWLSFYEALKLSIYALFIYLNINVEVFNILIIFMCIDSFLGSIKSMRMGRAFSFKKLIWGFCLKLCLLIIPLIVALLGKGLGHEFEIGVDIVIKILIVSEAFSAFGNIYTIINKIEVQRIDVISILLIAIRKALKKVLNKFISIVENSGDCKIEK